eukprot:TRINITY_DN541_c0_g1_i1.p1 TRINITY_DN541_c0_g1~~TRINITY_DN541_c0_g1_i1.p1  ORF type:complete len:206 (+),score=42.04 TRINITY_DN541_c0_g1_i1:40-618(+)
MRNLLVAFFLVAAACVARGQAPTDAEPAAPQLLVQKTFLTKEPVALKDTDIIVRIFNIGGTDATDVELFDDDWSESNFTRVQGIASHKWDVIPAQGSVNHTYVVRSNFDGIYSPLRAHITYRQPGLAGVTKVVSSTPGYVLFESFRDFERRTATHWREWGIFFLLSLASLALPTLVYAYYQLNFEKGVKKEK